MRKRLALTMLAAMAVTVLGFAGAASAHPATATHPAARQSTAVAAAPATAGQRTLLVADTTTGTARAVPIPAGADIVVQPNGFACIANPILACGYVFSSSQTETIYRLVIQNGVNAAASWCSTQLNNAGFGYLSWVCNAAAGFVSGLADPKGACLFVGAAGTVPIAVYTRDSCA
ncbi:hypothetical protein [Rugosimonospora africana]|uniref:Secreted protein n=1 Tax=Rugosimonospora africana TaxID=556532 RepID=A0A8J3VT53_9ACTN|nr:hypothetical protein [Rugosimonospora africana]GIH17158.1 hypothetical protein Raf01_53300 [Rugosimonospora africana]